MRKNLITKYIGRPAQGRVVVEVLPDQNLTESGFNMPDAKPNQFGLIAEIGRPEKMVYSWWEMMKWHLFRIHPCPYTTGSKVLLPRIQARTFEKDGKTYKIFWQTDIAIYDCA